MTDFAFLYIIVGLFAVILSEFVFLLWVMDRESKEKHLLLERIQSLTRALISKNANDYVMTTSIDKVMTNEKEKEIVSDEIPEENLTDDEFFNSITKSNRDN